VVVEEVIDSLVYVPNENYVCRVLGQKQFELANHLGNVLATVLDRRTAVYHSQADTFLYFVADVVNASMYYPFGSSMATYSSEDFGYSFGFNGMLNDNELKGLGNSLDFGARIYDSKLARFLSIDPLIKKYPHFSSYMFAGNNPIYYIDKGGEHQYEYILTLNKDGSTTLKRTKYNDNWFAIMDYTWIGVEVDGQRVASYMFTPLGTNGDHSGLAPSGGGHNNLDQVKLFLKDPLNAMLSADYTTEKQIMQETAQEIALTLLVGRYLKTGKKGPAPRLPQDTKLGKNKPAPPAMKWQGRTIGKSTNQNKTVQEEAKRLEKMGARDIRINQQQVDADGNHVGINRPDLQYTLDGKRHYIEYDTKSSVRGAGHEARIRANDPNAGSVKLVEMD